MTAVGCTPVVSGRPDTGAIAIPVAVGRPAVFNCHNVSKDSVFTARRRYYGALADSVGGEHMQAGYWQLTFLGSREWCYADGDWGADGLFHLVEGTDVHDCFWVDSYDREWVSWDDPDYDPDHGTGNDAPSGDTQPVPTPPVLSCPTPAVTDSEPNLADANAQSTPSDPFADLDAALPPNSETCSGAAAASCMAASPGVWLGVLPLSVPLIGDAVHHTAVATTPPMGVSELWANPSGVTVLGPNGVSTGVPIYTSQVFVRQSTPQSNRGFPGYKWVKIGDESQIPAVNDAVDQARAQWGGTLYLGTSNMFTSTVLSRANIHLSWGAVLSSALSPGLCSCPGVCP
ncbi:MAG: hypothetical protein ACREK8_00795 [Gemmatimonadales bacterium]